jgi:dihydrodipicolinate synthase/N-acetylneuraminate lyase
MRHTSLGHVLTNAAAQFSAAIRQGHVHDAVAIADRCEPLFALSEKNGGQPCPLAVVDVLSARQIKDKYDLTEQRFAELTDEVLRSRVSKGLINWDDDDPRMAILLLLVSEND